MNAKLQASIVNVADLLPAEKCRMFALLQLYYDAVTETQFLQDLAQKDAVILLREKEHSGIQGFSTLRRVEVQHAGRRLRGIFSGDTVIAKEFWGQRALGKKFLEYLLREKLRHPFQPLYWLLISKGYKTYLLMANNFGEHYPRYECATPPDHKAIADAFYSALFSQFYQSDIGAGTGHIRWPRQACSLKPGVADIAPHLLAANPRIAFFQRANPEWQQGVELACFARMTFGMPLFYAMKSFLKSCWPWRKGSPWLASLPEERKPV